MKILIAADGSAFSRAAADYVARQASQLKNAPQILVMHVHPQVPLATSVGKKAIDDYYREESAKALRVAEEVLEKAGIGFTSKWCTGQPAEQLARQAEKEGVDLIVTGTRGHGGLAGLAMGSVTNKLIALTKVPVLVIPKP